jgi:integrase
VKLTDRELKRIKPTGKTFQVTDGRGLSVRVNPAGTLTFQYRFVLAGKEDRVDIGNYPVISLLEAREQHHALWLLVKKGVSPAAQKRAPAVPVEPIKISPTVTEFVENEYIPRYLNKNRKRAGETAWLIRSNLLSVIGHMRMEDVELRHVTRALDVILDREAPILANRAMSQAKQLFSYAVRRGVLKYSPIAELRKKEIGGDEPSRDRALSNDEIRTLLANLHRLIPPYPQWLMLLLLLGQRQGEVRLARKEHLHLDGDNPAWTIPIENQKTGKRVKVKRDHVIPLPPQAVTVWKALLAMSGDSDFVMPSPHGSGPFTDKVLNNALANARDRVDGKLGYLLGVAQYWTPHDLRRTLKTRMSEDLAVPPHITERLLNHSANGMEAVYNLATYQTEMRQALCAWADRIDSLAQSGGAQKHR